MTPTSKLIKKACLIFGMLFFLATPLVWASLFFTTYQGDLTRIGKWLESDFGWQEAQPMINPELLASSSIDEADALAIGDSFSENLHWQSVFTQHQLKVTTLTWSQIGDICEDFPDKLKDSGFKGKTIIIESIERIADRQLKSSANCKTGKSIPKNTYRTSKPMPAMINPSAQFNIQGQFIAGLETILHSAAIRLSSSYAAIHNYRSKGSHIYPIQNGCEYFSHQLCQYGLFFHEDYEQPPLGSQTLANLETINQRLKAFKVVWVIVPNKSSIYQREISGQFWVDLNKQNLGPNLFNSMQKEKFAIKDMYAPNDTHLSTLGYFFLGQQIEKYITR